MKDKSPQVSSEGDRTFDFKYKLDISDRKGKTGQTFKQQSGFDFQDFKDFRQDNRTLKSQIHSQKKYLASQLIKRSQQSLILTQNPTELSIKKRSGSFLAQNSKISNIHGQDEEIQIFAYASSPRFNNIQKPFQTVSSFSEIKKNKQQFQKQKSNFASKFSMPDQLEQAQKFQSNNLKQATKQGQGYLSPKFNFNNTNKTSYNVSSSRNKIVNQDPQAQIKQILSSIQFISAQNQKLDYQTYKIMQQIEQYKYLLQQNPNNEYQIQKLTEQTNQINQKISNQRSLQRTLIQSKKKLEQNFDEIIGSIQALKFSRPIVMKDQTKAIVDQINSLKAELDSLKRDEGSLNLSLTLFNPNSYNPPTNDQFLTIPSSNPDSNPERMLMKQYLQQIVITSNNQSQSSPNYLFNIKMMTIKDEWKMYEDTQLCINCSTREYPMMQIRIGNKSAKNLTQFKLKEGASLIAQKQVLKAKSYYIHCLRMTQISQPFSKLQLVYKSNIPSPCNQQTKLKQIIVYLPLLPLKHGQFLPITHKQYNNQIQQHKSTLQQIISFQKPVDTAIIKQKLQQLLIYFPNFLYQIDRQTQEELCKGIFKMWNSVDGAFIQIYMRDGKITIKVKNNIVFLMQSLQFLFTLQV